MSCLHFVLQQGPVWKQLQALCDHSPQCALVSLQQARSEIEALQQQLADREAQVQELQQQLASMAGGGGI